MDRAFLLHTAPMEGVDYAFTVVSESALYAAGKRFAMRYVGPGSASKHLTVGERDRIWAAGLDVVLLVEGAANGALGGRPAGVAHAQQAVQGANALGAPALPMYFAVDFDCTVAQWPACAEYLRGAASVIGASRVGIYAGIRPMQWAARDKVAAWFFQTYAWSGGAWYAGNNVEQYRNGVALAGGTVDLCRSKTPQFGQWSKNPVPPVPEGDGMIIFCKDAGNNFYRCDGVTCIPVPAAQIEDQTYVYSGRAGYEAIGEKANAVGPAYYPAVPIPGVPGHNTYLKIYDMGVFGVVPPQGGNTPGNFTITFAGTGDATPA